MASKTPGPEYCDGHPIFLTLLYVLHLILLVKHISTKLLPDCSAGTLVKVKMNNIEQSIEIFRDTKFNR